MKLDLYDRKILSWLDSNSRASASEIGRNIKLPKENVLFRIKRLYEKKAIISFNTLINASHLGYSYFKVLLSSQEQPPKEDQNLVNFLLKQDNCTNVRIYEGKYNLGFLILVRNYDELRNFLSKLGTKNTDYLVRRSINLVSKSHKLSKKFFIEAEPSKISFTHDLCPTVTKVDDIDRKILSQLDCDARMKSTEIAEKIDVDEKTVRYRIKRMEKCKLITGYGLTMDLPKLGYKKVQIDITLRDMNKISSIIEFFDKTNACLYAHELIGEYDLSLELYMKDDEHLKHMLNKFKEKFFGQYLDYNVSYIFSEFFSNWSPFKADQETKNRYD